MRLVALMGLLIASTCQIKETDQSELFVNDGVRKPNYAKDFKITTNLVTLKISNVKLQLNSSNIAVLPDSNSTF